LDIIRKREALDGDITSVVHNILQKVGSSAYYTEVIALHPKMSPQNSANVVIIHFQSTYHKRYASAEIQKFWAKEKYTGVCLRDLFLAKDVLTSRDLTSKGFELKKRGVITKFRVENIKETPTIYVAKRGEAYVKVSDIQLNEMLQESMETA